MRCSDCNSLALITEILTGTACTSCARFCEVTTIFSTVIGSLSDAALAGGAACATTVGAGGAGSADVCATTTGAAAGVSGVACATTVVAGALSGGDSSPGGGGSAACAAAANKSRGMETGRQDGRVVMTGLLGR